MSTGSITARTTLQISQRAIDVPASPIRKLAPLAAETAARGIRIHHVNIGQPDLPAPQEILDAIKPPENGIIPYAPSGGQPETVRAWCRYYAALGIELEPRDVLVTTGGGEAIGFALLTVTDPGDEVLILDPTYASYMGYAATGNVTLVPICATPPAYRLPPASVIEDAITPLTRAIVVVNPGNPTGTVYTREEIDTVMDVARRHGLFVISDETYRELTFDGREHVNALAYPDMADAVILVDSVSKRFSATGLRVGCIASKNNDVMAAVLRIAMARLSSPTVEQLAAVPMLENSGPYTEWLREEYQRRRDATYSALLDIPGVSVSRPEGAFYVMAGLPIQEANTFARWLLTEFQHDGETVMVAPGPGFFVTPNRGTNEIRIAYVLNETRLRRAVDLLGKALAVYPDRLAT
ncbi:MAG: pyridoxal phosphate-dependent aminotransferase [Chloroflexota bacterium]